MSASFLSPPADVTVVIVTYNSARHIEALGRGLASSFLSPRRMLVVDNASTDDTVIRARSAGFEVLERGSNDGFGTACNVGLREASTEFVLFCNPDVRPSSQALDRLLAALVDNPTAAIAGGALDEPVRARRFARITSDIWIFLPGWLQRHLRRFGRDVPVDQSQDYVIVDYAIGAFILCRVAPLLLVNGFDERFFLYSEEEDLSRRLGERGWKTLLVPSAVAAHATSTSSDGGDGKVMAPFLLHSLYWYYRKHRSRVYAEFARCVSAACVTSDCIYRKLTRQPQVYSPKTAVASFLSIDAVRRDYERFMATR